MSLNKSSKSLILLGLIALVGFGAFYAVKENGRKAEYAASKDAYLGEMKSTLTAEGQKKLEEIYDLVMNDPGNVLKMPTYVAKKDGKVITLTGENNSVDEIYNNYKQ